MAGGPNGKKRIFQLPVNSLQIACRSLFFTMTQKTHLARNVPSFSAGETAARHAGLVPAIHVFAFESQ
jgi:hypothetical protein